jgi:hypothetical protein
MKKTVGIVIIFAVSMLLVSCPEILDLITTTTTTTMQKPDSPILQAGIHSRMEVASMRPSVLTYIWVRRI